jgi:hypothetical protein
MTEEELTLLEVDYTPFDNACQEPAIIEGQAVQCRRHLYHNKTDDRHATRFGARMVSWSYAEENK